MALLDQADERDLPVGDVGPVERRELLLDLEQQAQRGLVLGRAQLGRVRVVEDAVVDQLEEDVARDGRDHGVEALGPDRLELARVEALPVRRRRPAPDGQVALDPGGGLVDADLAAARLDLLDQPRVDELERPARVAEQLLPRLLALRLPPQRQLAPQPRGADLVRAVAELRAQQRAPDLVPRRQPHRRRDPLPRRVQLERRDLGLRALHAHHGQPHPQPRPQRHRLVAQQVERRRERPLPPVREHRHARLQPVDLDAQLVAQRRDVAVGREPVVVVALDQHAVADVERRALAAQPGPALEHDDLMALLGEPVRGDESRHPGPDDTDPHTFLRALTTYSGRPLTSS